MTSSIFLRINVIGLVLLIFSGFGPVNCLPEITNFTVEPSNVNKGSVVTFTCLYDTHGADLYSVKIYHGKFEFYRYMAKEHPATIVFLYQGININSTMSNATQIVLQNVGFELSGNYSCEITTDVPFYAVAVKYVVLAVIQLPKKNLEIRTSQLQYKVGDTLKAECVNAASFPKAFLEFTIKGMVLPSVVTHERVNDMFITKINTEVELKPIHFTKAIDNIIDCHKFHFISRLKNVNNNNGVCILRLTCSSRIADYAESTKVELSTVEKNRIHGSVTASASKMKSFFWQPTPNRIQSLEKRTEIIKPSFTGICLNAAGIFSLHLIIKYLF